MSVLDDLAALVGAALGGDATLGGFVIGAVIVLVVAFALALIVESGRDSALVIGSVLGTVVVVLIGLWPWWVVLLLGLFAAAAFVLWGPE